MECWLPEDKVQYLHFVVYRAKGTRQIRLYDLQSLLGKLNFACQVILMGRVFCCGLAMASAGVTVPSHFVRLSAALHEDLTMWADILDHYNRRSLVLEGPMSNIDLEHYTDVSGAHGFGVFF